MISTRKPSRLDGPRGRVLLQRTAEGVARIQADQPEDLQFGLGYAHAHDRLVQMAIVRLVGQGRLAECLQATPEAVAVDTAMRRLGMRRDAEQDVDHLLPETRALCEAYSAGVNHCLARRLRPVELLLAGHRPEPWRPADILLTVKLLGYAGLAQEQQDAEKWLCQALLAGADLGRLRELFRPHLDGLDPGWLEGLSIAEPLVPDALRWAPALPKLAGSNNWVVAGSRTASGFPMVCNDPHLEVNRLPAIWYEAICELPADFQMGVTMPGISGIIIGRTRHVAIGLTYGFADQIDYFVEDCKDKAFRRGADWVAFDSRTEVILRKGAEPLRLEVHENLHGVLEGDPTRAGRYLCRAWTNHRNGASASLDALAAVASARTAAETMDHLARVGVSGNWVLADRDGNIGYQQSGAVPVRTPGWSGLHPAPGWEPVWDWQGLAPPERLSRLYNPPEGFIATANDDWNRPGHAQAINLCTVADRAERIRERLREAPRAGLETMRSIQNDLVSRQARRLLELLRPCLPDTEAGRRLEAWDGTYGADSVEAAAFEACYREILDEVFGKRFLGPEIWKHFHQETGLFACFYGHFDRILLEGGPEWFAREGREALLRRACAQALASTPGAWGQRQTLWMTNIFFQGKLPRWLGFDHGPIELPGSRATIPQAAIFRSGGRSTSFAASWRMVADLGEDALHTNLAGGPSGQRGSPWYTSDVQRWVENRYKVLRASPKQRQ